MPTQFITGSDGKGIGRMDTNSYGGMNVYDNAGKMVGYSTRDFTYDGNGRQVCIGNVPGILLSRR